MASLEFRNVSKSYDNDVVAVKKAKFVVKDKEFIVLVGPSGCGKSTLLRMIAGLEKISMGSIYLDGKKINDVSPKDRNIAMVFQNYALYPHMTVYENMAFGLKLRKYSKYEIEKRVHEAAELLELTDLLKRKPKALSGGQRQRVALGRAIVRKPAVFLFDEPLSNLDAKLRVQMRLELNKLHKKLQTTIVYVTHDQVEAMTMGDRIIIMKDGIIQQIDTPINVYNNPDNLFVAGFIGSPSMNFFKGKINKFNKLTFKTDGFEIDIPDEIKHKLMDYDESEIILGIRPEHFTRRKSKDGYNIKIKATVELIEPMGSETYFYLVAGGSKFIYRTNEMFEASLGSQITLYPKLDRLHFYSVKNGKVIV